MGLGRIEVGDTKASHQTLIGRGIDKSRILSTNNNRMLNVIRTFIHQLLHCVIGLEEVYISESHHIVFVAWK